MTEVLQNSPLPCDSLQKNQNKHTKTLVFREKGAVGSGIICLC